MQKYFDEKATDCSVNKSRLIAPAKIFVAKIASSERERRSERAQLRTGVSLCQVQALCGARGTLRKCVLSAPSDCTAAGVFSPIDSSVSDEFSSVSDEQRERFSE